MKCKVYKVTRIYSRPERKEFPELINKLEGKPSVMWHRYAEHYRDMAILYDRVGNIRMCNKMWRNYWEIVRKVGERMKEQPKSYKGERKALNFLMWDRIERYVKGVCTTHDQWDILNYMFQLSDTHEEIRMVVNYKIQALYDLTESREIVLKAVREWLTYRNIQIIRLNAQALKRKL